MRRWLVLVILAILSCAGHAKENVGWAEKAVLFPGALEIKTKVDTGTRISSLNCEGSEFFEKDGAQWVKFRVTNYQGDRIWLERKVQRMVRIKRHFWGYQERPVVRLGICLGGVYQVDEVNIIDRSGLEYPMLIGRQFLKEKFLVDPGAKFINSPHCEILAK